ncbi:hypothetical protein GGR52DRAFT_549391 [Hypoxylon sp. FL1284]|nr:hypothetical protein GGR52DRAFT_549391 [Hypoxylon sp. FL1284]
MEMNGDFTKTFVVALVVSAIAVVAFLLIIYYVAQNWSRWVRRSAPNQFETPPSEKVTWPQPRESGETKSEISPVVSPVSSPMSSLRSSRGSNDPILKKYDASHDDMAIEPVTPPRNVRF